MHRDTWASSPTERSGAVVPDGRISRDRQATGRRRSLTSRSRRGAGCLVERTVVGVCGRRSGEQEAKDNPGWWLIDPLQARDGHGRGDSNDDVVEIASILEPA